MTRAIRVPTAGEKTVYDESFATRLAETDEFSDRDRSVVLERGLSHV